jgi:hypothetical protein
MPAMRPPTVHQSKSVAVGLETVWKLRTGSVSWSQKPARGSEMVQFSALRATEHIRRAYELRGIEQ